MGETNAFAWYDKEYGLVHRLFLDVADGALDPIVREDAPKLATAINAAVSAREREAAAKALEDVAGDYSQIGMVTPVSDVRKYLLFKAAAIRGKA